MTTLQLYPSTWDDDRYWPEPVAPQPSAPGAALDLLDRSIAEGATIVAIGGYTNLAMLACARPGVLDGVRVVAMGGWLRPPDEGFPQWGPEMDFNVQCDTRATEILLATDADLTLVPLWPTMRTQLTTVDLPRLREAGPVGALLARQAEAHAAQHQMDEMGQAHGGLDNNLLNFQWDPVACAVALGWPTVETRLTRMTATREGDLLRLREDASGRPVTVLDDLDPAGFQQAWLESIAA